MVRGRQFVNDGLHARDRLGASWDDRRQRDAAGWMLARSLQMTILFA
jgi:hypothetical protein